MKKTILTARESFEMQEGKGEGGCYSWIMASCFFPDATNRKEVWQPEWLTKGIVGKWLANYNFWETGHFISSGSNCYSSPFALGTPPEHSLSVSLHQRKLGSTLNFFKTSYEKQTYESKTVGDLFAGPGFLPLAMPPNHSLLRISFRSCLVLITCSCYWGFCDNWWVHLTSWTDWPDWILRKQKAGAV